MSPAPSLLRFPRTPRSGGRRLLAAAALALGLGAAGRVYGDATPVTWRVATQCGAPDAALADVAQRSARRQQGGAPLFNADELAFNLRAAGDPHVWPRAWSIAGQALADDDVARRVKSWLAPWNTLGTRRCGVAKVAGADGTTVIAAVAVDALADLAALPTSARVGQWITLEGTMLVPATAVKVVLLGPRGAPRTVLASLSGNTILDLG
jgi:hypothetical protein